MSSSPNNIHGHSRRNLLLGSAENTMDRTVLIKDDVRMEHESRSERSPDKTFVLVGWVGDGLPEVRRLLPLSENSGRLQGEVGERR